MLQSKQTYHYGVHSEYKVEVQSLDGILCKKAEKVLFLAWIRALTARRTKGFYIEIQS